MAFSIGLQSGQVSIVFRWGEGLGLARASRDRYVMNSWLWDFLVPICSLLYYLLFLVIRAISGLWIMIHALSAQDLSRRSRNIEALCVIIPLRHPKAKHPISTPTIPNPHSLQSKQQTQVQRIDAIARLILQANKSAHSGVSMKTPHVLLQLES